MGTHQRPPRRTKSYPPLAQRLRECRAAIGRTQEEVAAEVGISRAHLAKLETGGDGPGLKSLSALATVYGVTIDYLERGTPSESENMIGETVKDSSEAALLRHWRVLDDSDKWDLMAEIGRRIGKPISTGGAPAIPSAGKKRDAE